jgi:hypothetical protein
MSLLTTPKEQTPRQRARAQIEQALSDSVSAAISHHNYIGKLLTESQTGASAAEILAEFGEDAPLLLAARNKAEEAIASVLPETAKVFAEKAAQLEEVIAFGKLAMEKKEGVFDPSVNPQG